MADDKAKWENLTVRAREFVSYIRAGNLAAASVQLNDQMKESLPGDSLVKIWQSVEAQTGKYQSDGGGVRTAVEQGFDSIYLETKFEAATIWVKVVFQGDKVAGLQVVPQAP
jgi:hypothetical protein